jgi:hypothetical protein
VEGTAWLEGDRPSPALGIGELHQVAGAQRTSSLLGSGGPCHAGQGSHGWVVKIVVKIVVKKRSVWKRSVWQRPDCCTTIYTIASTNELRAPQARANACSMSLVASTP